MKNSVCLIDTDKRNELFSARAFNRLTDIGVQFVDIQRPLSSEKIIPYLGEASIIIASWGFPKLDEQLLHSAPNLELIVYAAGSVKGIITDNVWARNIRVSSAANALSRGVGETALGLTIVSLKNIWHLMRSTEAGKWTEGKESIRELYDVTIGVVGAGHAGRHYIHLLKQFDVNILVYDPTIKEDDPLLDDACHVELDELLRQSDVVSIHAPSIPATYKMFNRERFAQMKDGATIINTARGSLIDEQALIEECRTGRIQACIDVTDPEPPAADHPFRTLPNVILTPHIAGAVNNGLQRIGNFVTEEIISYLKEGTLAGEVTPSKFDILA